MKQGTTLLAAVCVLVSVACADDPTRVNPVELSPVMAAFEFTPIGLDATFSSIEKDVPGFAGIVFAPSGELMVHMSNPDVDPGIVRASLSRHSEEFHGPARDAILAGSYTIQTVPYSWGQLSDWHSRLLAAAAGMGSFISADIDEFRNQVAIGMEDAKDLSTLGAMAEAAGIPAKAVRFERETPPVLMDSVHLFEDSVETFGGITLATSDGVVTRFCSSGFAAEDWANATYPQFNRWVFGNSHCTSFYFNYDGNAVKAGTRTIGWEVLDPQPYSIGACPPGKLCRASDAALFQIDTAYHEFVVGKIAKPTTSTSMYYDPAVPYTITQAWTSALVNTPLKRVGRGSGQKSGTVVSTCQTVTNPYGGTLVCQDVASMTIHSNDSGAPMFYDYGSNQVGLVGMAWGQKPSTLQTYYSSLSLIMMEFGNFDVH